MIKVTEYLTFPFEVAVNDDQCLKIRVCVYVKVSNATTNVPRTTIDVLRIVRDYLDSKPRYMRGFDVAKFIGSIGSLHADIVCVAARSNDGRTGMVWENDEAHQKVNDEKQA